jgi:hypothetical protein
MNIMETVGKSRPAFGVSGWQEWETIKKIVAKQAKCTLYFSSGMEEHVFRPLAM